MTGDPLLQPFRLKHLTLRNRVMTTAHEPAYAESGLPTERYIAYHAERARGGVALAMTAGSASVSRDSPPAFNNILAYRDEVVPWIRRLTDACHEHGAAVMIQLTHLGRRTRWDTGDWLPSLSPSRHREPAHRAFPKLIEDWDMERIKADFADAAERMQQGGMDGIEIEAYGHLLDQFWSPLTNDLDGAYGGGSLENRMRFSVEVLEAIRARVGQDFIVGIRHVADEAAPGGIDAAEGIEIARRLSASGLVDFLNVIRGRIHTDPALTDVIPIQGMKSAPHLEIAARIRRETTLPVFHAARIQDVATARHAVGEGLLDMVGMTRAHIADPHIVAKIINGREADIRPCVGANYCLDRIYQGGEALCIHNAATGRELSLPQVIGRAHECLRIIVVGAGPGGLEAARVAACRGHEVTVFEAAPEPGGQVRLLAQSPRRREMIGIIDWRMEQCTARGVEFRFSTWAETDDVTACAPDVVIVATGGMPQTRLFEQRGEQADLVTCWDIIAGDVKPAGDVLIHDESGDPPALQAAEIAIEAGARVELMTPDRTLAPEVMGMNLVPYMRALQGREVRFTLGRRLLGVARAGNRIEAVIGSDYGGAVERAAYDMVVLNYGTQPLDELYFELKPLSVNGGAVDHEALLSGRAQRMVRNPEGSFRLFRIGDAVSSRNIHAAIHDALRLMQAI